MSALSITELTWLILLTGLSGSAAANFYIAKKYAVSRNIQEKIDDVVQSAVGYLNSKIKKTEEKNNENAANQLALYKDIESVKTVVNSHESQLQSLYRGVGEILKAQTQFGKLLDYFNRNLAEMGKKIRTEKRNEEIERFMQTEHQSYFTAKKEDSVQLAKLTPTEMDILRLLVKTGPKSASEIREIINKTREHSGRLMKKLYLSGYVERDTSSIPFRYKIAEKIKASIEFSADT